MSLDKPVGHALAHLQCKAKAEDIALSTISKSIPFSLSYPKPASAVPNTEAIDIDLRVYCFFAPTPGMAAI